MNTHAPIDPEVVLPPSVRAAAARAQQLFDSAHKNEPPAEETPAPETPGTENSFTAPAADTAPVTPEVTQEAPAERTEAPVDDQSWEHRYKSMKGRHDRAAAQINQLSEQISNLQNVIASMQLAQPSVQRAAPQQERLITPEEESDYGQDFLNVVGKRAKEELLPIVQGYESKIADLEARLEGVGGYVATNARERMQATMDSQVPDWRELNFNPDFIQWLKLPDPYSGAIRHDMLKEAYGRNDTARVANFFKGFLAEEAAVDPAERGPDLSRGVVTTPAPEKIPLETFAAPGRAKTAAASAPAEKPSFTRAEIARFYQDSAAGKFRGREPERDRIEKQIFDAEREGRIR